MPVSEAVAVFIMGSSFLALVTLLAFLIVVRTSPSSDENAETTEAPTRLDQTESLPKRARLELTQNTETTSNSSRASQSNVTRKNEIWLSLAERLDGDGEDR